MLPTTNCCSISLLWNKCCLRYGRPSIRLHQLTQGWRSSSPTSSTDSPVVGSVLGPLLLTVAQVLLNHLYADDTQLYMPLNPSDPSSSFDKKSCKRSSKNLFLILLSLVTVLSLWDFCIRNHNPAPVWPWHELPAHLDVKPASLASFFLLKVLETSNNSFELLSDLLYFEDLVTCEERSRSPLKHSHRSFNIRHFQTRRYETKVFIELLSPSTSARQILSSWPHIRNSYMLFQTPEQMKTVPSLYFTSVSLLICLPVSHPRSAFCFLLSLCLWTSVFSCSTADYLYQGISIIAVFFSCQRGEECICLCDREAMAATRAAGLTAPRYNRNRCNQAAVA